MPKYIPILQIVLQILCDNLYEIGQEKFSLDFYPCKSVLLNFVSNLLSKNWDTISPGTKSAPLGCIWCCGNMICCKNTTMNRFQQCQLGNIRCCKPCSPLHPSNKAGAYLLPSVWKYVSLHFACCMNAHIGAEQSGGGCGNILVINRCRAVSGRQIISAPTVPNIYEYFWKSKYLGNMCLKIDKFSNMVDSKLNLTHFPS